MDSNFCVDMDKTIAYEMAQLLKENRELKEKVASLTENLHSAFETIDSLRAKLTPSEKPISELLDYDSDIKKGDKVVFTAAKSNDSRYVKGFVVEADHVAVNASGCATLIFRCLYKGTYYYKREIPGFVDSKVNNKTYSWRKVDSSTPLSMLVETDGIDRTRPCRTHWTRDRGDVSYYLACKDLIEVAND